MIICIACPENITSTCIFYCNINICFRIAFIIYNINTADLRLINNNIIKTIY